MSLSLWKCAPKGRWEGDNARDALRLPSVLFPWFLAVHRQSFAFRAHLYHAKNEAPTEEAGKVGCTLPICRILDPSAYGFGNALSISLLDMRRRALGRDCHMSPNTNFLLTLQSYAKATCGYISRRVSCRINHFVWTRSTKKRTTLSVWLESRNTSIVCNHGSLPIYTNLRLDGFN